MNDDIVQNTLNGRKVLQYNDLLKDISKKFDTAWSGVKTVHNYEHGDETEVTLCTLLREFLPAKFGICRGYVVSQNGETAGDDIIIYDKLRFPTVRNLENDFSKKDQVPIEAVYAYIEAKTTINIEGTDASSLYYAFEQAAKVKELCNTRKQVPLTQISPSTNLSNVTLKDREGYPPYRNPMYSMIFARNVRLKVGAKSITDPREVQNAVSGFDVKGFVYPDFVTLGRSNVILPGVSRDGKIVLLSPFYYGKGVALTSRTTEAQAYGSSIAHLFWALDQIELHPMSWGKILADGLKSTFVDNFSDSSGIK